MVSVRLTQLLLMQCCSIPSRSSCWNWNSQSRTVPHAHTRLLLLPVPVAYTPQHPLFTSLVKPSRQLLPQQKDLPPRCPRPSPAHPHNFFRSRPTDAQTPPSFGSASVSGTRLHYVPVTRTRVFPFSPSSFLPSFVLCVSYGILSLLYIS